MHSEKVEVESLFTELIQFINLTSNPPEQSKQLLSTPSHPNKKNKLSMNIINSPEIRQKIILSLSQLKNNKKSSPHPQKLKKKEEIFNNYQQVMKYRIHPQPSKLTIRQNIAITIPPFK